ncbi:MAG: acyl-coenzyme A synthetase/AMP-(fatty) acid ligase [Oleiphilaceae bacterium]|jgi:acyl-coenzyme A synthetase/AMP-(fatty) acid ligase
MNKDQNLANYWQSKAEIESQQLPENFRELINRAVDKFGEQCAINCFEQGKSLSYVELRDSVNRLADGLTSIGIGKGSHVAVMLSNRIEYQISWLALGVLGAVMIPVNTRYTANEIDYLINDGDGEFFITEAEFLPLIKSMQKRPTHLSDGRVVVVDESKIDFYSNWFDLQKKGSASFVPQWDIKASDLMNIQYTSGTTGFPKGCMQAQRYWIVLGTSCFLMNPTIKSLLSDHPFFYMDPQWQLILGLYGGATVYSACKLSASKFVERLNRFNIEMGFFPRPLISEVATSEQIKTPLKKLYTLGMGINAQKQIGKTMGLWPFDVFGMTEIGMGVGVPTELAGDDDILGTCGVASPFREARVALDDGSEANTDEVGELWIRGDGIFQGYYKKPQANTESFSGDWFKTGDLFIRDNKGYHRIVGRKKDMIRRSSENISALEVEQVLSVHPKIKQAAAVAVPDDYRGEEVKVYLLLREGEVKESIPPHLVIEHCRTKLAEFKIPRFIEYVAELPYTPSEKVAKHKLVAGKEDLRIGSWDALEEKWC